MRVGTSPILIDADFTVEDHPHACGDKRRGNEHNGCIRGSSPCVWGQANTDTTKRERMRIIPMRVGTSFFAAVASFHSKDHPHACGDKQLLCVSR